MFHPPRSDRAVTDADARLTISPVLAAAPVSTPPATVAAYASAFVIVHPC
jgi:hypothetical protein